MANVYGSNSIRGEADKFFVGKFSSYWAFRVILNAHKEQLDNMIDAYCNGATFFSYIAITAGGYMILGFDSINHGYLESTQMRLYCYGETPSFRTCENGAWGVWTQVQAGDVLSHDLPIDGPSMEEDMEMDDMAHAGGYSYIVTCLPALIGGVRYG